MLTVETNSGRFQFTRYSEITVRRAQKDEATIQRVEQLIDGCAIKLRLGWQIKVRKFPWAMITGLSWCASLDREEVARHEAVKSAREAKRERAESLDSSMLQLNLKAVGNGELQKP